MVDHHIRTRNWLTDLALINQEIDQSGLPVRQRRAKRTRSLKPLWEE